MKLHILEDKITFKTAVNRENMRLKNKSGCFAVIYIRTLTYCLLLFCILCHDSQNMSSLWINIYIAPLFINFTVYSLLQPSNISMQREMRSKNNEKHNAYFRQRGECDGNARWWWFMHIMDRASQMNDSVAQQFKVMLSFSIKVSPMAFNFTCSPELWQEMFYIQHT